MYVLFLETLFVFSEHFMQCQTEEKQLHFM